MAVGTDHEVIRIYDLHTAQSYVSAIPSQQHTAGVSTIKYSACAKIYASGSSDGSIKLWDAVSGRCINTFAQAHDNDEVCSVFFSRNGKVGGVLDLLFLFARSVCLKSYIISRSLFPLRPPVSAVVRQGLDCEIVGAEHQPLPDRVHRRRQRRQAGEQHAGGVQSHRGLCDVTGRGVHIAVLVELAECVPPASDVARSQRPDSAHRALADQCGLPHLLGRLPGALLVPANEFALMAFVCDAVYDFFCIMKRAKYIFKIVFVCILIVFICLEL